MEQGNNKKKTEFQIPYTPAMIRLTKYHLLQPHDDSTDSNNNTTTTTNCNHDDNDEIVHTETFSETTSSTESNSDESTTESTNTTTTTESTTTKPATSKLRSSQTIGLQWLQTATYHKNTTASHMLAQTYEHGTHSIPHNPTLAAQYYHYGATHGHVDSMAEYALCCELGVGVEPNDIEALD